MHFEVLVEDQSGSRALDVLLEKILGGNGRTHSWRLHSYKGIGRIPRDLRTAPYHRGRQLLNCLPALLRGYGRSYQPTPNNCVIVVVDLDTRDCIAFKRELVEILATCDPRPRTLFRMAIEESEAWLLGDRNAVETAYPNARAAVLDQYVQDSVCGTWEVLADAVYKGGSAELKKMGYPRLGKVKCDWALRIAPHVDVNENQSRSFQVFREGVERLANG